MLTLSDVAGLLADDRAAEAEQRGDAPLTGIALDSRAVRAGHLFAAVPGGRADGHDHAADAVRWGAAALLVSRWLELPVPQLRVRRVRAVLGRVSARVHGEAHRSLQLAAVTGTNGKTTTSWLLQAALAAGGSRAGTVGTLGAHLDGVLEPTRLTTPEAPDLARVLARMVDHGADSVVVEASSIAIDQGRLDGLCFSVAVHTGLEEEHLDHHGTVEHYYASKAALFDPARSAAGVVRVDDPWGVRLAAQARVPVLTFGFGDADVVLDDVRSGLAGTAVTLRGRDGLVRLEAPLLGRVNAVNLAAAYLAARRLGVGREAAVAGLAERLPLPGRHHVVLAEDRPTVVVDYAHTPRALAALVGTGRDLAAPGGRVTVVFGARGDRARAKRPELAAAAATADRVVLTADSTQREELGAVLAEYRLGLLTSDTPVLVEPDRRRALHLAVTQARAGDVVLVAGRGHEVALQSRGRPTEHFDDSAVCAELLDEPRSA